MTVGRRIQHDEHVVTQDKGVTIVPFGFTINGTSNPDGLIGDTLKSVVRNSAGNFTLTFRDRAVVIFGGEAFISVGNNTEMGVNLDWSLFLSAGTCVLHCDVSGTDSDPADDTLVGGMLLLKNSNVKAR